MFEMKNESDTTATKLEKATDFGDFNILLVRLASKLGFEVSLTWFI